MPNADWITISPIILVLLGTIAAVYLGFKFVGLQQSQATEIKEKIADAESKVQNEPEKTKPAWDLARVTLEAYFNRNLSQIASIFWLSAVVMFCGFLIIVWGVFQAIRHPDVTTPATISTLSGVVTEFIGATFLFIYRSTIQQAANYSKTLERINSVGMAMQILDTMPDNATQDNLKSKTKAIMVELLIRQTYEAKSEQPTKTGKASKAIRNEAAKSD
jgi:hypothetical protein